MGERSPRLRSTSPIRRRRREYTHGAPGVAKDPGAPSVGVRLERPQTPGPLGGGGLQVGEQGPALVAEPDPARSVMPAEPATVPLATARDARDPEGMCRYAARNCVRAELRMSVPAGMIGAPPFGSFPRNTCSVLVGEERSWEGGEGRVQAERPERESPPGQGYGPEGKRRFDLYRSPDPGRWCPGGCPEQVVQLRLTAC